MGKLWSALDKTISSLEIQLAAVRAAKVDVKKGEQVTTKGQ
ncbi:Xyloglucan endotransglucosylase/hydrolase [Psidium guajava]|nr:Xyloglucan endotransglucosylase/hydrolase [Psidium guajava]